MNLIQAVMISDIPAISELLAQGADVNERDRDGRTPLMQSTINARTDIMRLLLQSGAKPDVQDNNGWSALHFAAQGQSAEGIELLVSRGAAVDIADSHGNSPLSRAVFAYKDNGDAITTLLRLGADRHRENKHGVSPSSLAHEIANYDVRKFF